MGAVRPRGGSIQGGSTFVLCHRRGIHGAVRKSHRGGWGGGGSNTASPPPRLFGCPLCPMNTKGRRGALWVSLEDIHVTMGVHRVKGCCVLHVCFCSRKWEGCSTLKVQMSKKFNKNSFKAILP